MRYRVKTSFTYIGDQKHIENAQEIPTHVRDQLIFIPISRSDQSECMYFFIFFLLAHQTTQTHVPAIVVL